MKTAKKIDLLFLPLIGIICAVSTLAYALNFTQFRADAVLKKQEVEQQKYPPVDPMAWKVMNDSRKTRYYFNEHFISFTSALLINDNGKHAKGKVDYDLTNGAIVSYEYFPEHESWPTIMVSNIIGHRRQIRFEDGDGRHPITFGPQDDSPLGRLILLNDRRQSSYRIKDGRVSQVNRREGKERFSITVLEEIEADKGAFLPKHFIVSYYDVETDRLLRTEAFADDYAQVQGVWFPLRRRVFIAQSPNVITRILEFQNPVIKFRKE